jgi:molybdopterin/thiamine biosynthesis adenylyltransferase
MSIDYLRQLDLLDPRQIGNRSVTLIGAGATGSHIAWYLAQLGWGDANQGAGTLKVFDHDKVESHNLANQIYEPEHIGLPKVEALRKMIIRKFGFEILVRPELVSSQRADVAATYVFLLTDTMSSREEIFEKCLRFSFSTDLVIETRMGLRDGRIYAFNPNDPEHVEEWKKTLYKDDEAQVSRCGASASIISTVTFIASMAVGRLVQHFNCNYGNDTLRNEGSPMKMWNEVHFSLYPEAMMLRQFGYQAEPVIF